MLEARRKLPGTGPKSKRKGSADSDNISDITMDMFDFARSQEKKVCVDVRVPFSFCVFCV